MKMTWQGAAAARVTRVDNNNRIILLKKMNGIYVGNIKTMLSSSFGPPPETWDVQKSVELWRSEVRKTARLQTGMSSVRIVHDTDTESWAVVSWSGGEQPPVVEEKQIVLDQGTEDLAIVTSNGGAQPSIPVPLMERLKRTIGWEKLPPTQSPTQAAAWNIGADGNTQLPEIDYHGDISYNVRFAKAFTWFQKEDVINKPFVEEANSEITEDYKRLFIDMVSAFNTFDYPTPRTEKITEMAQFIMKTVKTVDDSKRLRNFKAWNHATKFGEIEEDVKIYEGRELPAIIGYLMIYTSGDENQDDIFQSITKNFLNTIESFIGNLLIDDNRFSDKVMNDKITQIIKNTSITDDDPLIRVILNETYMRQASPFFVHTMLQELDPLFEIFERDIDCIFFIIKEGKTCDAIRAIANTETYFAENPSIKESILSDYLADPNDETIVYGTDENVDDIRRVIRELEVHFLPSLTWWEKISLYWSKDKIFVLCPDELGVLDGYYILNEDAPPELVLKKLKQIMANRTTPTKTPEVKIELTIENILKGFMSESPAKIYYTFKRNDNPKKSIFLKTMSDLETTDFVEENYLINAVSYIIKNLQEEQKTAALRFWGDVTQKFVLNEGNLKLRTGWYHQTENYKQDLEAFIFGYMFVSKENFNPNDFYDSIKKELVDSFKVTNSATISNNGFFESSYPLLNFTLKDIVETVKSTTQDNMKKIRDLGSKYKNFIVNILPLLLRMYIKEINEKLRNIIIEKNGILFEEPNGILSEKPPENPPTASVILCLKIILNLENEHETVMQDAERVARETKRTEEAERKKAEKAAKKAKLEAEALELKRKQDSKPKYIKLLINIRNFETFKTLVNSGGFSIDKLNDADSSDVIDIANVLYKIIPQKELERFNSTNIVQRGLIYWSVRHNIEAIKAVVKSFIKTGKTGGEGADTAAPQTSSATPATPAPPAPPTPPVTPAPQTQTAPKKTSATQATQKTPAQNKPDTGGPSVTANNLSSSMKILRLKGRPAYTAQHIRDVIQNYNFNEDFNNDKSKINGKDKENIVSNLNILLDSDETLKNTILKINKDLFQENNLRNGPIKRNLFTNCTDGQLGEMIRLLKANIQ